MNSLTIVTLLIYIINSPNLVAADLMARFVFHNLGSCDSTERPMIEAIFGPTRVTNRRILLRESRALPAYPSYCKDNCRGYATGRCFATNCVGWKGRELDKEHEDEEHEDRELQTCDDVVNAIHQKLDNLKSQVTPSCRTYLGDRNSRQTSCYNDVIYGAVHGARFWKITSTGQTVLHNNVTANGFSFCKSTSFNIEALNDLCVDNAVLDLKGPNGYHRNHQEINAPYSLFGDSGTNFHGQTLTSAGLYTLTITPDGFDSKKKVYTFTLNNC